MGPPGAGKGTQASTLADKLGVPQIATGHIFRSNVSEGTELGRTAKQYLDAGDYVPDSVTNEMVRTRLREPDAEAGFVLDGYPRTLDQVSTLDDILAELGTELDAVVSLTVDSDELVARLVRRADSDGRSDDDEAVIRYRQEVYVQQTAPLLDVYAERGLLVEVDGLGEIDDVRERIATAITDHTRRDA
jgi:adenylate kinase